MISTFIEVIIPVTGQMALIPSETPIYFQWDPELINSGESQKKSPSISPVSSSKRKGRPPGSKNKKRDNQPQIVLNSSQQAVKSSEDEIDDIADDFLKEANDILDSI